MAENKAKSGYELSRDFFDFCFENSDKIKPGHIALYFFIIEHCNRLGWKTKFRLPTTMAMEAIGIKSYNTYSNHLCDLIEWDFVQLIQRSTNQYSANVVALSINDKASNKALDKALIKHHTKQTTKHRRSTDESIGSIDKPYNNTVNNEQQTSEPEHTHFFEILDLDYYKKNGHDWEIEEPLRGALDKFLAWRQTEHPDKQPITSYTQVEEILREFLNKKITPHNGAAMIDRTIRKGWKNIIYKLDEDAPATIANGTEKLNDLAEKW